MKPCLHKNTWHKAPGKPEVCGECGRKEGDYSAIGWLILALCAVLVLVEIGRMA